MRHGTVPPLETCTATGWRQILALPTSDDEQWRSAARTFHDTVRIVSQLMQFRRDRGALTAYILENSAMQWDRRQHIREGVYTRVVDALGEPVNIDAARFGAGAHRDRRP